MKSALMPPNRRLVVIAALWLASFALVPLLMGALQGRTEVTVVHTTGAVYAEVDGTRLDIPPDKLPPASSGEEDQWAMGPGPTDPPTSSLYWQPAHDSPLAFIGKVGEWLQTLRPRSHWENTTSEQDPATMALSYHATLVGGRQPASLGLVQLSGDNLEYLLVVRAERRSVAWWRAESGRPIEQLSSAIYRPRGRTTSVDFAAELVLVAAAASALAFLAWVVRIFAARLDTGVRNDRATGWWKSCGSRLIAIAARPQAPVIALVFAGTLLGAAACLWVLDGIPHVQDDVGYLFQGRIFALGRSWVPVPPGPEFFANGFIQMFEGKWFAKYPPGYPLLLAPGFWLGAPWLVNALSAGVSLGLVFATGRRMYGIHVAAWAALIGLLSPWVIFMSGSFMSHPTTMMWVALFLYALARMKDGGTARGRGFLAWPLVAGFAIGMAFITRQWTAGGVAAGAAVWALGDVLLRREPGRLRPLGRYALLFVGFLPPLLFILFENVQLTGDWLRFSQDLVGSYDRPGFGPGHGDAVGHTPALGVYNTLVYLRTLATMFTGWPQPLALAPLALGAVAWVGDRGKRFPAWDALLWLGTLGLVAAYFVWWSSTTIYGPRYWYEAMPFMLLIAGRGLDTLGKLAASYAEGRREGALRWGVPGVLLGLLSLYTLTQSIPVGVAVYNNYNGISAEPLRSAEKADLRNALVFVQLDPAKPNRDYGKVFFANDPLLRGERIYARDLGAEKNRGLLGAFPGRDPYWLPLEGPPQPGVGSAP